MLPTHISKLPAAFSTGTSAGGEGNASLGASTSAIRLEKDGKRQYGNVGHGLGMIEIYNIQLEK